MTDKATLTPMTNAAGLRVTGTAVPVHFNPESLALTIRNQMEQAGEQGSSGRPPQQLVSSSEVTLALQLVFDTTMTGTDVRATTAQIAEMMRPGTAVEGEDGKKRAQVVKFEWNTFAFEGIISDYSETLDYFSDTGVPLRSNLSLSITKHEDAFPAPGGGTSDVGAGSTPPTAPVAAGDSADDLAGKTGNPGKGKQIAAANGVEDIRNVAEDELASPAAAADAGKAAGAFGSALSAGAGAGAGIGLEFGSPPAAFASGDAGFGLDLGLSAGASVGAGASLSAGASLGGGAGAGIGLDAGAAVGAAAGAGASFGASAGGGLELDAFAGLNPPDSVSLGASLGGEISFDLPEPPGLSAGVALGAGAGVSLGGAAGISLGAGAGIGGGEVVNVGKEINLADILFKGEE